MYVIVGTNGKGYHESRGGDGMNDKSFICYAHPCSR